MAGGESRKDAKTAKAGETGVQLKSPMEDPVILKIAENHEKTPAQVILHWLVQNQFGVIPKSSNEGRIRQNMEIFDFRLTDEEMKCIRLADKNCRLVKGQVFLWEGANGWEDLWDTDGRIAGS